MPTYEYQCFDCNEQFERFQKISDPAVSECPSCGGSNVKRLISATAFHLKGTGWYKTDYGSSPNGGASKSSDHSKGSTTAEASPDKSGEKTPTESKEKASSPSGSSGTESSSAGAAT
jgi:putative FmdB family regulatory protein